MENRSVNILENKWLFLFISLIYLSIVTRSDSISWIIAPFYLIILATYLTKSKGYVYNFYIITCLISLVLECLLLVCVYSFDSVILKVPVNLVWFLGTVVVTLFLILFYTRSIITGELKNSINKLSKNPRNTFHFNEKNLEQMKEGNLVIILAFASSVLVFFLTILISPNIHYVGIGLILAITLFVIGLLLVFMKINRLLRSSGFKI